MPALPHRSLFRLTALLILATGLSGCVTYKNPASNEPPVFSPVELRDQVPCVVTIRAPSIHDFASMSEEWRRQSALTAAQRMSSRLVNILNQCQLFLDVRLIDDDRDQGDIHIEAIPQPIARTQTDDPWLLMYGGIIPVHSKNEKGIAFHILKGGSGEFTFSWIEESVIGFWAPVVDGSAEKWKSNRDGSSYWSDLRKALYQRFSDQDCG